MSCNHRHSVDLKKQNSGFKLLITILLNLAITISEIIGGILSRSLSLLSDAFHNLTDVISLIVSYFALKISARNKNEDKTFGYKRAEVIAALFNVIMLFITVFFIVKEAVARIFKPEFINAPLMLIVAVIGLLGNLFSIMILIKDAKKNINIKSAFLHLLGDTASSVGVILVAGLIFINPALHFLDPFISIIIVIFILKEAFKILTESINILMQASPSGIKQDKIVKRLKKEKSLEIIGIHHFHSWGLSSEDIIVDFHAVIPKKSLLKINEKLKIINHILACEFNITHTTIQFESENFKHSHDCEI